MITTLLEFNDASSFERTVLSAVFPLANGEASRTSLNLRNGRKDTTLHVMAMDGLGEDARQALIDQLRPLFFGAAGKILDLLLEVAFHQDPLVPKKQSEWQITEKSAYAQQNRGTCLPLSTDIEVWSRLCQLYAGTEQARHAIVHRGFEVSASGDMTQMRDKNKAPVPDLTVTEQEAFCRVAQRAASACLTSQFSNRDRLDLVWWLDKLTAHHGRVTLGGSPARPVELIQIDATRRPSGWTVDLAYAFPMAQQTFTGRRYFDVEIYFPGSGIPPLTGRLEDAPHEPAVPIDPSSPPLWMLP